jgi:hypothetical protein
MRIRNIHERTLAGPLEVTAGLLDSLSGPNDLLWPGDRWPPMRLHSQLCVGSTGGHGDVHYSVSEYDPGRKVVFRFENSGLTAEWHGWHCFEVVPNGDQTVLRHTIDAECGFRTWLFWTVVIKPLHDALLEDALDRAERAYNPGSSGSSVWSPWVRFLRFLKKRKN